VAEVHVWVTASYGGKDRPKEAPPVPAGLHYDLWLGPVPELPYSPEYLPGSWRNWWAFGGGALADFGCHFMDLPHCAGLREPLLRSWMARRHQAGPAVAHRPARISGSRGTTAGNAHLVSRRNNLAGRAPGGAAGWKGVAHGSASALDYSHTCCRRSRFARPGFFIPSPSAIMQNGLKHVNGRTTTCNFDYRAR
jgi:hypothetical protein